MDVVLLNTGPNVNNTSMYRTLGAYKIAHSARQAGYTAQVIDHVIYFTKEQLIAALEKYVTADTLVLGISTTFLTPAPPAWQFPDSFVQAIDHITARYPRLKLIFGGYGLSIVPQCGINNIYAVVLKYGEDIFAEVLKHISGHGDEPPYTVDYTKNSNQPYKIYTQPLNPVFNIESDSFRFVKSDAILPNETLPIEISRGCIFKCKFCNHLMLGRGKLDYLRSFELVKAEMLSNYENFGTTNYYVICDTFNDTEFKVRAWHDMVTSLPFKIKFTAYARADLLDRFPDVPHMLQESGLFSVFHGIETLGKAASVSIGKGWSGTGAREYIPKLYHDIWKTKVHQSLSFIVGLPGDTRESIIDTADWFRDNDLYNISWHPLGLSEYSDSVPGESAVKVLLKNSSEFEKESAKYGYYFPIKNQNNWHNQYWSSRETVEFANKTMAPMTHPYSVPHGSWTLMQLLQYGFDESRFLKQNRTKWNRTELAVAKHNQFSRYIRLLMSA